MKCKIVQCYRGDAIFSATQRCNVVTIRNNVTTMLQRCVALKVVVANRLVQHHIKRRKKAARTVKKQQ